MRLCVHGLSAPFSSLYNYIDTSYSCGIYRPTFVSLDICTWLAAGFHSDFGILPLKYVMNDIVVSLYSGTAAVIFVNMQL